MNLIHYRCLKLFTCLAPYSGNHQWGVFRKIYYKEHHNHFTNIKYYIYIYIHIYYLQCILRNKLRKFYTIKLGLVFFVIHLSKNVYLLAYICKFVLIFYLKYPSKNTYFIFSICILVVFFVIYSSKSPT